MPKILFIASHRPDRSPSQRFRFEQYLSYFKEQGFDWDFSWIISEKHDKVFYQPGNTFMKGLIFMKSVVKRMKDVLRAGRYDIIFVQREAFMTGSTFFEKRFSRSGAKLVFDFDDAIWLHDVSDANRKLGWLKNPRKTEKIISMSHLVIAGNEYLAAYARQFNKHTVVIPTTVDTERHKPSGRKKSDDRICIGWSGSLTTIKHFESAIPILEELKAKYGDRIYFKAVGDESYVNERLGVKSIPWRSANEVADLEEMDIGFMPLPDTEWAKGKCGLKGLTYMAMEIPAILSRVGVNSEIIQDGVNGYLADTHEEWMEKFSLLIEDAGLRKRLGMAGRATVEQRYSVHAQRENYLKYFRELSP